jgi:hypothetical protein
LADSDNKDLADHPRVAKDAGKALDLVVPVAPEVLAVLADQVDQAQNVLVGLISKGQ